MKFIITIILLFQVTSALTQSKKDYQRFIDSADIILSADAEKALKFLDSVPKPIENYIKGNVGKYYLLRGYAYERTDNEAKTFQNLLLSVRYAEEEKDFEVAGGASIALFKEVYFVKKDTTAYKYLENATKFYTMINDESGIIESQQMPAYVAYTEGNYKLSNTLLLENLELYKNYTEDAYYYLFANFMLASNYTYLNDIKNANKFAEQFRNLKQNATIAEFNYNSFDVSLNITLAKLHFDSNQIDSSFYYLSSANKLRDFMNVVSKEKYYSFTSEIYKSIDKDSLSDIYVDSLRTFQKKILADKLDASLALNDVLIDTEKTLTQEKEESTVVKNWLLIVVAISIVLLFLIVFVYKKIKLKKDEISRQKNSFLKLQSKNEKLKVRTQELENYITDVKDKIKQITSTDDEQTQQNKIRSLYRTINAEATNFKNSGENHINILKEINESFFVKIKNDHSKLTDSEYLISYYLKLGFKNKEIASFLGRSIRGIESQRFRISKKMQLESSKHLTEFIQKEYSDV